MARFGKSKGNPSSMMNGILKSNEEIDEILYGIEKNERKKNEHLDEINSKIKNLNLTYEDLFKTQNLIEFITQNQIINTDRIQSRINAVNKNNVQNSKKTMESILQDSVVQNMFSAEKDRIETYADYRIVDAYIPQVSRTIDLFRDSILSPDDITKRSINVVYDSSESDMNEDFLDNINKKIKELKKRLKFDKRAKSWLRSGLVDGDVFVAILKLDKELNRMLLNESSTEDYHDDGILTESEMFSLKNNNIFNEVFSDVLQEENKQDGTKKHLNKDELQKDIVNRFNNNIIITKGNEKYRNLLRNRRLNDDNGKDSKLNKPVRLNGSIIRVLEPENTVKMENEDGVCFGYIYIEKYDLNAESGNMGFGLSVGEMLNSGNTNQYMSSSSTSYSANGNTLTSTSSSSITQSMSSDYFDSFKSNGEGHTTVKEKFLTDLFVTGISKRLDNKTIEKNSHFKEVIYSLVRRDYIINKKIRITYFEPDEVVHYKPDSDKTYGISKLSKILFYAKLFLSTLLTQTMQKVARGRDKRVVYVETGIEDDLEDSIQEVIREFKSKEIQSDVLKSISSVLRRIGTFEDYFLPKIDGEVPVDFETISGMDVNMDDEFIQFLLKSMISGMGLPNSYVDESNNVDFSRSLLMQNTTFVRDIVSDQQEYEEFLTEVFQKVFNYEYFSEILNNNTKKKTGMNVNDINKEGLLDINILYLKVILPVPEYLNIANTNEQIQNYQTKREFIVNTYFGENTPEDKIPLKEEFSKEVTKKLISTIDWNEYDELLKKVEMKMIGQALEDEASKGEGQGDSTGDESVDDDDLNF